MRFGDLCVQCVFIVCSHDLVQISVLLVPVSGEFSGAWVVQTYSVLQWVYDVYFEHMCFAHSP